MSYAKPIWNEVISCGYSKSPSWGGKNNVSTTTYTGSSASNSNPLATVDVSRKFYLRVVIFNFYVDDKLYKQNINLRNGDKAGDFIETRKRNFVNSSNELSHPINKKIERMIKKR